MGNFDGQVVVVAGGGAGIGAAASALIASRGATSNQGHRVVRQAIKL